MEECKSTEFSSSSSPGHGPKRTTLTAEEVEILKKQIDSPSVKVNYLALYRYANKFDKATLLFCTISAIASGIALPFLTLLLGNITGAFGTLATSSDPSSPYVKSRVATYSLYFVYLGVVEFVSTFVATAGFSLVSERLTYRIRESYLSSIMIQNLAFFESIGPGEVSSRISTDINLIQDGISEKVTIILAGIAAFFASLIIAFVKSWKLTLIVTSSVVFMILTGVAIGKLMGKYKKKSLEAQGLAGNIAEEALSSIRITTAYGAQEELAIRYSDYLSQAGQWGVRVRTASGLMMGALTAILYLEHALSFWQGSRFLVWGEISLSAVITIQLAVLMAGAYLGLALPHFEAIITATAAGQKIFTTIDRVPALDPRHGKGIIPKMIQGRIDFEDIKAVYPSRDDIVILEDFNFCLPSGMVTAVVGPSGCGKSTLVSLIERFYLPVKGKVRLDGTDVSELEVRWLRQQMSVVSQDPILFDTTIFENIEMGLVGTEHEYASTDVKISLVIDATKKANAFDFINTLPNRYDTHVGNSGVLLSGGQKQRIAIARAIVSNPKILILDEATSALDGKSEAAVQIAIEQVSKNRTTLVIAHRLSTIRKADQIAVMYSGKIVEQGTHKELVQKRGVYSRMVMAQNLESTIDIGSRKEDMTSEDDVSHDMAEQKICRLSNEESLRKSEKLDTARDLSISDIHEKEAKVSPRNLLRFMWNLNKHDRILMAVGVAFAIVSGCNLPGRGIIYAYSIMAISYPLSESARIRRESNFWAGMFFLLAGGTLIAFFGQGLAFAFSSERLIHRAQTMAFRSILRQDISFFDKKENSPGALSSLLSSEASRLAGMSGATLGAVFVFLTTVLASIGIALGYGWKLGLVCMSAMPLLIIAGWMRFWVLAQYQKRTKQFTEAAAFASEATSAIRTVVSLTIEERVLRRYQNMLTSQKSKTTNFILKSSMAYSFSQCFVFFCMALGLWYGGGLVASGEYNILRFFVSFTEILFGAQSAGNILSFAPEIGSGRTAAESFKKLIELKPKIESESCSGDEIKDIAGRIELRDIHFHYPERPDQEVLRGVSLHADPGEFIALVGSSGSGKSTIISLLERFYDAQMGSLEIDGKNILSLQLSNYRHFVGLVNQDSTVYTGTIKENLTIGLDTSKIPEEELITACKCANMYSFVLSLPQGFQTLVGPKGNSLSGGQRQRLAIARALLRNPRILLLDEATSALDSESEKAVESALRTASQGRTTIAIAHRLSSIRHADRIYVLEQGKIVECGTHEQLIAKRGRYCEMVRLQSLETFGQR